MRTGDVRQLIKDLGYEEQYHIQSLSGVDRLVHTNTLTRECVALPVYGLSKMVDYLNSIQPNLKGLSDVELAKHMSK